MDCWVYLTTPFLVELKVGPSDQKGTWVLLNLGSLKKCAWRLISFCTNRKGPSNKDKSSLRSVAKIPKQPDPKIHGAFPLRFPFSKPKRDAIKDTQKQPQRRPPSNGLPFAKAPQPGLQARSCATFVCHSPLASFDNRREREREKQKRTTKED